MTPRPAVNPCNRVKPAPGNLLSKSVLAHVFLLGLDESRIRSGWCWTVVNVCRRWRSIALTLPALWARIYVRTPADACELPELLARAKNANAHVHIVPNRVEAPIQSLLFTQRMLDDAIDCVIRHSGRIAMFRYRVRIEDQATRLCAQLDMFSADRFNTLMLEADEYKSAYSSLRFGIFGGHAPVLRTLTTSIVLEDWAASPAFRRLRHFTLRLPP